MTENKNDYFLVNLIMCTRISLRMAYAASDCLTARLADWLDGWAASLG